MVEREVRRRGLAGRRSAGVIGAAGVALLLVLSACSGEDRPAAALLTAAGSVRASATGTVASTASSTASSTGSAATGGGTGAAPTSGAVDDSDAMTGPAGTYSVVPPEGWTEATDRAAGASGVDLVLLSPHQVDGFSTNLVVHVAAGDEALMRSELAKGRDELADEGRTTADAPPITLDGLVAEGFSTEFNQSGVDVVALTYGVHRERRVHLLTLSSAKSAAAAARADLAALADGWTWS